MNDTSKLLTEQAVIDETSLKYMVKLAGPMIATTISFTIMQFVDRLMVARLGTTSLAAILPAGFMSFIPGGFAGGLLACVSIFVSQSLGRGERSNCSSYCWQAIFMGLAYTVAVAFILWPAAPTIFRLIVREEQVASEAVIYFRIMLYVNVLLVFVWSCSPFFMGIHRPIITMYAAMTAQVVNVIH